MRTGLHANTVGHRDELLDYYRRSLARTVKFLEFDGAPLDELKALGVTIIGRVYVDHQTLDDPGAQAFIDDVIAHARKYPQVDFWEGYNEDFQQGADLSKYAQFEIKRMRAMDDAGLRAKAIIGCFSTGRPEVTVPDDWERFRPALDYAKAHGHALGLHEYSGPYMQWLCGENQWDFTTNAPKRVDDPCSSPIVEGWLTMRYRKAYQLFAGWGLASLPLYITEGGIDDVTPRPGGQGKGYKDFANTEWARLPGIGDYAQQRRWYMWQTSHDAYVQGVVDFGWAAIDPTWASFNLATDPEMLNRIILLESDLPLGHFDAVPIPPPVVDQPPVTPDVSPSVLPMLILQSGWNLLDCAAFAYPDEQTPAQIEANARAIARANGLDYTLVATQQPGIWLPRYLVLPRYQVARVPS
jgi:hypothetical protein